MSMSPANNSKLHGKIFIIVHLCVCRLLHGYRYLFVCVCSFYLCL
jgi:hypothetical protein